MRRGGEGRRYVRVVRVVLPSCLQGIPFRFQRRPHSRLQRFLKSTSGRRRRSTVPVVRGVTGSPDQYWLPGSIFPQPRWSLTPDPTFISLRSFRGAARLPLQSSFSAPILASLSRYTSDTILFQALSSLVTLPHVRKHSSWLFSVPNSKFSVLWKSSWVG
jgi:hypothetical protein